MWQLVAHCPVAMVRFSSRNGIKTLFFEPHCYARTFAILTVAGRPAIGGGSLLFLSNRYFGPFFAPGAPLESGIFFLRDGSLNFAEVERGFQDRPVSFDE